jgi:hypothetical protein
MKFAEGPARPVPALLRFPFLTHRTLAEMAHVKLCVRCRREMGAFERLVFDLCLACRIGSPPTA